MVAGWLRKFIVMCTFHRMDYLSNDKIAIHRLALGEKFEEVEKAKVIINRNKMRPFLSFSVGRIHLL